MPTSKRLLSDPCARLALVAAGLAFTASAACGPSNGGDGSVCKGHFIAGDLVITEVMANPAGTDSGNEWFEIFNARGDNVDLTGLVIASAKADGAEEKTHAVELASPVLPHSYFVLGNALPDLTPEWVNYGYSSDLGDLRNSAGGRLELRCGDTVVDSVIYGDAGTDGVALGFDGALAPDYLGNDDTTSWCSATLEFADGNFGSPGAANEGCNSVNPTTCNEAGTTRDPVAPVEGDLVITEVMANPDGVDGTLEWFELLVTRDVDLNGLELGLSAGTVKDTLVSADCLRVTAGTRLVFARSADQAANGGLPLVDQVFDFVLANTAGSLFVGYGGVVLDSVTWATSGSGIATALDPDAETPTGNDDAASWCAASASYGPGGLGTPGAANAQCPLVVPEGSCLDGETVRAIVAPTAGQLIVSEFMANPAAVGDTAGEYVELKASASFDLNGLEIGTLSKNLTTGVVTTSSGTTIDSVACLPVTLDETGAAYLVFARDSDSTTNGGIENVAYVVGFSLTNSATDGTAKGIYVNLSGTTLDQITYTSTTSGASQSLRPDVISPEGNDADTAWCATPATSTYGSGDRGTPGAVNPACS